MKIKESCKQKGRMVTHSGGEYTLGSHGTKKKERRIFRSEERGFFAEECFWRGRKVRE